MEELKKSGRDPGKEFGAASFRDDVQEIADLMEGIDLSGLEKAGFKVRKK